MTRPSPRARRRTVITWLFGLLLAMGAGVAVIGVLFWRYPIATFEVAGRGALRWAGFEKAETAAAAGRLVYFRAGTGPTLVFLHGANDQAGTWARVAPAFVNDHHVVVADLAGHGESEPQEGPLTMKNLVDGVAAVATAEGQGRPVTLVGNSLGGFLALLQAFRFPEQTAHAILVNGAIDRGDGSEAAVTLLPKTREEARKAFDALLSSNTPRVPAFVLDDYVRRAPTSPLARLMARPQDELSEFLIDDRLEQVRTPITLIWGEDDHLLSLTYARRAAARLPNVRLEIIPGCGHIPQRECPASLLARLRESLARVSKAHATPGGA